VRICEPTLPAGQSAKNRQRTGNHSTTGGGRRRIGSRPGSRQGHRTHPTRRQREAVVRRASNRARWRRRKKAGHRPLGAATGAGAAPHLARRCGCLNEVGRGRHKSHGQQGGRRATLRVGRFGAARSVARTTPGRPQHTTPGRPQRTTPGRPQHTTPGRPQHTTPGNLGRNPRQTARTTPGKPPRQASRTDYHQAARAHRAGEASLSPGTTSWRPGWRLPRYQAHGVPDAGILHGCLAHHTHYDEHATWGQRPKTSYRHLTRQDPRVSSAGRSMVCSLR
jgi:hypothetical protein